MSLVVPELPEHARDLELPCVITFCDPRTWKACIVMCVPPTIEIDGREMITNTDWSALERDMTREELRLRSSNLCVTMETFHVPAALVANNTWWFLAEWMFLAESRGLDPSNPSNSDEGE